MTSNITYIWSQELAAKGAGFVVYALCAEIKKSASVQHSYLKWENESRKCEYTMSWLLTNAQMSSEFQLRYLEILRICRKTSFE